MNKRQKEVLQSQLNDEKAVLKSLESNYKDALAEINSKIELLMARQDADMQHVIYQKQYQEALKTQVQSILENLQANEFESISEYLAKSYEEGFLGTMYDLQGQGIPLVFPIDQAQVLEAIQTETNLSTTLYGAMGKDIKDLQKKIAGEISRGLTTGMMYSEISRNIASWARIPKNNAMRIARTEAHRIQCKAAYDAQHKAKSKGADVVKQWDSTLDGKTRDSHRAIDGEIKELDEKFSNGLEYPGDPSGAAGEVINCRCALLQRARWALGNDYTKWSEDAPVVIDDDGTTQFTIIESKNYDDFKKQYNQALNSLEQMKIAFPEDSLKINGFTKDVKKQVDTALKKLNNEYDIRLNSIVVEPAGKGDLFVTGYHDGVVDMVVNKNADFNKIIKRMASRYEKGFMAGKSLEDYLAHEMAHCMLYQDCKTDSQFKAKYKEVEALYNSLKGISGYADKTKSGNEALAEAFVRVRNNEKVPPIVKVLVEAYFGKWKK